MRRIVILMVSAAALACGSDSKDSGPTLPTGTIGGRAFNAVEARAVTAGTTTACTVPNPTPGSSGDVTVGITGLKLDLTSFANICGDYTTAQCKAHANAQSVTILLAKLNALPPYTAPALTTGTYTVYPSATTVIPDTSNPGQLTVASAVALGTAAACAGTPSTVVQGGTVRIDQITAAQVTGTVNLTFSDGGSVQGAFTAPTCAGVAFDVCQIATSQSFCTMPPACI